MKRLFSAATMLLLITGATLAVAQTADPNQMFNRAAELAAQKRYDEALSIWLDLRDKLDKKYRPNLHKALGLAYQKLEMHPQAWHHLTLYLRGKPDDVKADEWLRAVQWELSNKYYKARFACRPLDARIVLGSGDKAIEYPCPLTWWFLPGDYLITIRKAGFKNQTIPITVSLETNNAEHEVELEPAPEPEKTVPPTSSGEQTGDWNTVPYANTSDEFPATVVAPAESGGSNFFEWTLVVSGIAIAGAGGFLHWQAGVKNDELHDIFLDKEKIPTWKIAQANYDKAYDNEVRSRETAAFALYGVGAAAALTGVILLAVGDDEADGTVSLSPASQPGGAGALFSCDF